MESPVWIDINKIDNAGLSPLMLAQTLNNFDAIRILCDHGANPKYKPFP